MSKTKKEGAKAALAEPVKPPVQTHWGLEVLSSQHGSVSREADPDDEWSRPDISNSVSVHGLRMVAEAAGADVVVCFEPIPGEQLHLLTVTYGTGDSFHHEDGLMEPVAAFRTLRLAELARAELTRAGKEESSVGIFDEDGSIKVVNASWSGYFETFEGANIETFTVEPAPAPRSRGPRRAA